MSEVIPNQDIYLEPFCDDTPTELSKMLQIYNIFTKIGDDGSYGYNSPRVTSPYDDMKYVSARVFDPYELKFAWDRTSSDSSVFNVDAGLVVVNNTLIELEAFSSNFLDTTLHWSTGGLYSQWQFTAGTTTYAFMCVLFEPYDEDGLVKSTEPEARIVYVQEDDIDYTIMTPIWLAKVVRSAGGTPQATTELLLEHSSVTTKIEQIGFWKNFIVDGGEI